jgi:hypothetical protein
MKKQYLSVSDLGSRGVDALKASSVVKNAVKVSQRGVAEGICLGLDKA